MALTLWLGVKAYVPACKLSRSFVAAHVQFKSPSRADEVIVLERRGNLVD